MPRILLALLLLPSLARAADWQLEIFPHQLASGKTVRVRAGYLPEATNVPFRGNILYFEGFADSMLNHDPLFSALAARGYRVVAFDYPGQGGSGGSMNATRLKQIPDMGNAAWQRFARLEDGKARKIILGWSTGGLAAYYAASEKRADAVILIAPGLHVHAVVGSWGRVTFDTLTSRPAGVPGDPHVDPIRPGSPMLVPLFAGDLLKSSISSRWWKVDASIPGLAILTGDLDRYVKAEPTLRDLKKNASHFTLLSIPESLHEVDNEADPIRTRCIAAITEFLAGLE